jgi:ATPase subunit of ABC transporter with duplicated ATPase domains
VPVRTTPVNLVNATGVRVLAGDRVLLDEVSLGLADGDAVGVVGRNGEGKSTLLAVLAGRRAPDAGRVSRRGGVRVGLLDQRDPGGSATVADLVLRGRAEHEWAGDRRLRDIVAGLLGDLAGAAVGGLGARLDRLSGGQRRRAALAAVLVEDPDLLLLDEPTNHLDVDGVAWLADHLRARAARPGTALAVVTHDRWFLDAVCASTWEVHDRTVDSFEGGYAAWVLARAERARVAAATEERRRNLVRKELAWLRRGAPARTAKPRFRLDAAAALIADEPPPRDSVSLERLATARLGKDVLDLEDVSVTLDTPAGRHRVLDRVTWRLGPGDRVGLVGANGAGKTTVLRLLTGERSPDAGRVRRGRTVRVAVLGQDVAELDEVAHRRAVEAVTDIARHVEIGGREVPATQLVEQLGFRRERAWTPVAELSGGERRRLQLLRLLLGGPNVLLLDEPTNDLDTDALAAVEDLLDGWAGTLVVVSHDRYLLERTCDRHVGLLGDGGLRDLPGGVEQYLALRAAGGDVVADHAGDRGDAGGEGAGRDPAAPGRAVDGPGAAAVRAARKEAARVERRLARAEAEIARLHAELAAHATDAEVVLRLDGELRRAGAEKDELEERWLEVMAVVETA